MDLLTLVYLGAYAASAGLYLIYHAGLRESVATGARAFLLGALGLQLADIAVRCTRLQHPASSVAEALAFIGWMIALGYFLASLRYRLSAAGAFAVPGALILLLLARVVPATGSAPPGSLGILHVFLATLGVASFALAAILETLYLVQVRRLKHHRLDRAKGGSAPLDTLDRLAARCVSVGFPVFTLALLTGALWVARLGLMRQGRPEYLLAVASWLAYGVLLVARAGAGWQGRRAAWLTVGAFSGVLLVVLGYFLRAV
jgi:ABC-type uncharacterized transport system permease subunit